MKKLLIIILLFAGAVQAQEQIFPGTVTVLGPVAVADLSGADTTLYFSLQGQSMPYSIQCVLTDTVETAAIGVYFETSTNPVFAADDFTDIADSLSFAYSTYPLAKYFVGESFPFAFGALRINKNGCTDGDVKFLILFR